MTKDFGVAFETHRTSFEKLSRLNLSLAHERGKYIRYFTCATGWASCCNPRAPSSLSIFW